MPTRAPRRCADTEVENVELRCIDRLSAVPAALWDGLHDGSNPFVHHAFLAGLETTGCLRPAWGWSPFHAVLYEGDTLVAAAPGYRKENSHGEFVFDQVWAAASERAGHAYYPKWLIAIPYSPVTGPRLLAHNDATRIGLLQALIGRYRKLGWSSLHVNFLPDTETLAFGPEWLAREDVQFHWTNHDWPDFDAFLAALTHKRRKSIRQERERVHRAGYRFRTVHGDEASDADLIAMHELYTLTFTRKGNFPTLSLAFFRHLATHMPRALVLMLAELDGRITAGALFLRGTDTLYGRYWGSQQFVPGLHFELCYYQGIEYCLREGLQRFEPGAQGEHKLARGFAPVITSSRHHVNNPIIADALHTWCQHERLAVRRYRDECLAHSAFRHVPATS